jgi:hypothetical protein
MNSENLLKPKITILLFVLIVIFIPFFESKRVLSWEIQRETQSNNIFRAALISYATWAERLKGSIKGSSSSSQITQPGEEKAIQENNPPKEIKLVIKPSSPFKILIVGDSFIAVSGGVGEILEKELLNYEDLTVKRVGKVSSGLSRPDYFNWPFEVNSLVQQYKPNIVVIMIGSNDAQSITTLDGALIANYGSGNWNEEYSKRVSDFLNIFGENNITVFWIGLPIMRDKNYSTKMQNLNSIYAAEVKKYENYYFLPTADLLADANGNYTAYLTDENGKYRLARQSDGIHLTYFGGQMVIEEIIKKMKETLELQLK